MNGNRLTPIEERRLEARRWLSVAQEDARVVEICLSADPDIVTSAAYHCQQAAEKLIKGMLVCAGVHFPKTHDLEVLGDMASVHFPEHKATFAAVGWLSDWAWVYRYPSLEEEPAPSAADLDKAMVLVMHLTVLLRSLTGGSEQ